MLIFNHPLSQVVLTPREKLAFAEVAKLVDALDLGSSAARRAGSIPVLGTRTVVSRQLSEGSSCRLSVVGRRLSVVRSWHLIHDLLFSPIAKVNVLISGD